MRQCVSDFVEDLEGVRICGSAASAEEALLILDEMAADLLLIDVSLPGLSGIDFVNTLRQRGMTVRCLMLSGHSEVAYATRALQAGANGYMLKGEPNEMEEGIRAVLQGGTFLSASIRHKIGASI